MRYQPNAPSPQAPVVTSPQSRYQVEQPPRAPIRYESIAEPQSSLPIIHSAEQLNQINFEASG